MIIRDWNTMTILYPELIKIIQLKQSIPDFQ